MNNFKKLIVVLTLLTFTLACNSHAPVVSESTQGVSLKTSWTLSGFEAPESVIPNADASFLYVSNVNGEGSAKDGNGYISKVSLDGKFIEKKWANNLNAPKGLALKDSVLYVSDIDQLVLIDTQSGKVLSKITIEGAKFLNDVAKVNNSILISDSATASIHEYINDEVSIWMHDSKLEGVNGLQQLDDDVLITTMKTGSLYKRSIDGSTLVEIATDMKNADGIGLISKNTYLISSWPGELHHVKANGETQVILDTTNEEKYMNDFLLLDKQLFMPNWLPGTLTSYTLD